MKKWFLILTVSFLAVLVGGRTLVAQELYLVKDEFELNQTTLLDQYDPAIATNGVDRIVVTWYSKGQDEPDSTEDKGIFARLFDFDGNPVTDEFQVNTTTFLNQEYPAVAMATDGSFIITWRSEEPIVPRPRKKMYDVYAQRFAADGTKLGDEFVVNTTTDNIQEQPNIGIAADGSFVIVWKSRHFDQSGDVFFQRYAADGTPLGEEIQANTYFLQRQEYPDIFMQPNGNFVLCWRAFGNGIKARIFDGDGNPLGEEIQANEFGDGSSAKPKIAGIPNSSSFMITWSNSVVDGSYAGVLVQRFTASGAKNGTEFIVNTTTEGVQNYPSIDIFSDSTFVIAYDSYGHDDPEGSRSGIYFKYFSQPDNVLIDETLANNYVYRNQQHNRVLVLNENYFMIAWRSSVQDEDESSGVFAKIYSRTPVQAVETSSPMLTDFQLTQNYPNPFNPATTIHFALKQAAPVQLRIYNARGELVTQLINGKLPAGAHQIQWDASGFASGIYFYHLQTSDFSASRKMILMR